MLVYERFKLDNTFCRNLKQRKEKFGFGLLGLAAYYRTYSRIMPNGKQERWADTVIRSIEGALSIRKDHYVKNNIPWDEEHWQRIGARMADAVFNFRFLPPGRGLTAK